MGICMSFDGSNVCEATANLILDDGRIQRFLDPVKAEQILKDNPWYFICSSDGIYVGTFISEVLPQEELQVGQLYFLLPRRKLEFVVSEADMASLLVKANTAAMQMGASKSGGKVHPFFNVQPYSDGEGQYSREQSSSSSSSSLCCVSRSQIAVGSSRKQWKAQLETIVEAA